MKVADESGTIAEVQADALRAIGVLADKVRKNVEDGTRLRRLAEAHVLLHTSGSRNVIDSVKMPLREAIRDPRQLKSAGVELVRGAGKCAAVAGAFAAVGVLLARALDAVAL